MIEYCIYNIWNGGAPFTYEHKTFQEAYNHLLSMIELEEKRNRVYYVDNDFYNNKYLPQLKNCKIFSIRIREVTEWTKLEDFKNTHKKKTNIIDIINYL